MKNKIKNFINNYGTTITVNSTQYNVLMKITGSSEIKNYLDDVEYLAVIKPAYFLTLTYDNNISENSTFTKDSRNYTIRKITNIYYKNETLYKVAIAY